MNPRFAVTAVALVALGAFAAPQAAAQNPRPGRGRGMQMLFQGITLSADQQAKIDSIRERGRAEMPAFTPGTPPDSATRAKMRDVMRQEADEIRGVLTPDQQKVFDRNLAEMRARRPGGP